MSLWQATLVVRRLCRGEMTRGGGLVWPSLLLALPAVAAIVLSLFGRWGAGVFDQLLEVDLAFLAPFLAATLFGPAIADELDRGTAGLLFVRPAPRTALLLGRLAAALPTLLASATVALAVGFVSLYLRFPSDLPGALPHLFAAIAAVAAALLLYSLLSIGLGAGFRRRPVATLLVIFLIDGGMAHTPMMLRILAPAHHLSALGGLPDAGVVALPFAVPVWGSAIYLVVIVGGAAWLGLRRIARLEMTGETAG